MLSREAIHTAINEGRIIIQPFLPEKLGPNSYDVHLGPVLTVYSNAILDMRVDNPTHSFEIPEDGFLLRPGELYLGSTIEHTETRELVPWLDGRSSVGRLGMSVHITAGRGDIGFRGSWTLEITVAKPLVVYAGVPIAQLSYFTAEGWAGHITGEYHGRYQGQTALPVPSRMHQTAGGDKIPAAVATAVNEARAAFRNRRA